MKTQTLFVISAAITAVLAYPTEDSDYTNYQGALTFPCGDTVSSVCIYSTNIFLFFLLTYLKHIIVGC
jgi:hypothetical protein